MKKAVKYNYKKLTITFDLNYGPEKDMIQWLEKQKEDKNHFSVMVKKALKLLMAEEMKKIEEKEAG
ncbi:MAG: hypothetical protein WC523_03910 [Patescibacteria group bacterium]